MNNSGFHITTSTDPSSTTSISENYIVYQNRSSFYGLIKLIKMIFASPKKLYSIIKKQKYNPIKVFTKLKHNLMTLEEIKEESKFIIDKLITEAESNGQVAFSEHLILERVRIEKELILRESGFLLFVTKEDIEKAQKNSERAMKYDKLQNFCRVIPEEVRTELSKAKSLEIFNEFKVLHFDPTGTKSKLTKEEIKKDPILFGIMEESERAYFIGDWIDEYCDLTFDKLIDKIGLEMKDRVLDNDKIKEVKECK